MAKVAVRKTIVYFFIRVTSLKVLGRSILLERLYALTDKFNTPIVVGFLKEAIIVETSFSHKDKSEKGIQKQLFIDQNLINYKAGSEFTVSIQVTRAYYKNLCVVFSYLVSFIIRNTLSDILSVIFKQDIWS